MYAVGSNNYGGPEVLHLVEPPNPHPASGQVRVRVHAAGINPVDVMVRDGSVAGWFVRARPPFVPGLDIAGGGLLSLRVVATFPIVEAAAHCRFDEGGLRRRLILDLDGVEDRG